MINIEICIYRCTHLLSMLYRKYFLEHCDNCNSAIFVRFGIVSIQFIAYYVYLASPWDRQLSMELLELMIIMFGLTPIHSIDCHKLSQLSNLHALPEQYPHHTYLLEQQQMDQEWEKYRLSNCPMYSREMAVNKH